MLVTDIKDKQEKIRRHFDEKSNKWYFSIVDVIAELTQTSNARNYWKVLKNRLKKTDFELVTKCNQLKMKASDGKFYLTDVGDVDTITEILKLISQPNVLRFKAWALGLNKPKIEKTISVPRPKMQDEIYPKNKKKGYPQVTYNLAKLLNKNLELPTLEIEEKIPKKVFKKVSRMGTI